MESTRAHSSDRICHGSSQARKRSCWPEGVSHRPATGTAFSMCEQPCLLNRSASVCGVKISFVPCIVVAAVLQSKTHVVLATLRRSPEELSSHHPKMFKIDDHMGVAVSGLNSDGRSLSRYMRSETLNHRLILHSQQSVPTAICTALHHMAFQFTGKQDA